MFGALALVAVLAATLAMLGTRTEASQAQQQGSQLGPPYVRTGFAVSVERASAILIGFVNARGASTEAFFEVGRTKAYGRSVPFENLFGGFHRGEVEEVVFGLHPHTTYHFRLVAENSEGKTYGKDKSFVTLPSRQEASSRAPGS